MDTSSNVIVRSRDAGVFHGELVRREGQEAELKNARRLWYWDGAASLSELAVKGVSKPKSCKFPCRVPSITILGVIEIIPTSAAADASINAVKEWKHHGNDD